MPAGLTARNNVVNDVTGCSFHATEQGQGAQHSDAIPIDVGLSDEIVDDVTEILHPKSGVFDEARFTAAGTLKACVERDDDESLLDQRLTVDIARGLFLATTDGVRADDDGILRGLVEALGEVDISGDVRTEGLDAATTPRRPSADPRLSPQPVRSSFTQRRRRPTESTV